MAISVGFMESLQGGQRTVQIDLGQLGRKEVRVDIPAGVQNGQQMLLENAVRQNSVRVNLVVQVRAPPSDPSLQSPSWQGGFVRASVLCATCTRCEQPPLAQR